MMDAEDASILVRPSFAHRSDIWLNPRQELTTRPFRFAVSKPAWRAYLGAVLFTVSSVVLFGLAFLSYAFFYANYVPRISVDSIVHLQYG